MSTTPFSYRLDPSTFDEATHCPPDQRDNRWWALKDGAYVVGVDAATVRRAIERGDLAAKQRGGRSGGRWSVLHSDLMTWAFGPSVQPITTNDPAKVPRKARARKGRACMAKAPAVAKGLIGERFDMETIEAYVATLAVEGAR